MSSSMTHVAAPTSPTEFCLLHRSRSLLLVPTHRREPDSRIGKCEKSHSDGDHPVNVSIGSFAEFSYIIYIRAIEDEKARLVLHEGAAPAHGHFWNAANDVSDQSHRQDFNFTSVRTHR